MAKKTQKTTSAQLEKKVGDAISELEKDGKRPTYANVRDQIGGGSFRDLGPIIKSVLAEREAQAKVESQVPDMPEDVAELAAAIRDMQPRLLLVRGCFRVVPPRVEIEAPAPGLVFEHGASPDEIRVDSLPLGADICRISCRKVAAAHDLVRHSDQAFLDDLGTSPLRYCPGPREVQLSVLTVFGVSLHLGERSIDGAAGAMFGIGNDLRSLGELLLGSPQSINPLPE